MMTLIQILIRKGLTIGAGFLVAHNALTPDAASQLSNWILPFILAGASFVWEHMHITKVSNPIQSPKAGSALIIVFALLGAVLFGTGCTITRDRTTINTPAVYNVTCDANGRLQTNLVSAASVSTQVHKDRLWLPEGYNFTVEQDVFGINVTPFDPTSTSAKVQAGVISTRARWTPTSTNNLFAPPITDQVDVDNKAIPFWLRASGQFTSGQVSSSQSDTNATSQAIIPH